MSKETVTSTIYDTMSSEFSNRDAMEEKIGKKFNTPLKNSQKLYQENSIFPNKYPEKEIESNETCNLTTTGSEDNTDVYNHSVEFLKDKNSSFSDDLFRLEETKDKFIHSVYFKESAHQHKKPLQLTRNSALVKSSENKFNSYESNINDITNITGYRNSKNNLSRNSGYDTLNKNFKNTNTLSATSNLEGYSVVSVASNDEKYRNNLLVSSYKNSPSDNIFQSENYHQIKGDSNISDSHLLNTETKTSLSPVHLLSQLSDKTYASRKKESLHRSNSFSNRYGSFGRINFNTNDPNTLNSQSLELDSSPIHSKESFDNMKEDSNKMSTSRINSKSVSSFCSPQSRADSDSKVVRSLVGTSKTRSKLTALQDKIVQFEGQLQVESQHRRAAEENRLNVLREAVICLEKTLNAEVRRRLEANKTIQYGFQSQLANLEANIDRSMSNRNDRISDAIQALSIRIQEGENEIKLLKEQQNGILETIEIKINEAITEIHSIKDTLESELKTRRQKEAVILDRLADVEKQIDNRLILEKGIRQKDLDELRSTIDSVHENHIALDDAFQQSLATEFHELKTALETESQAREQADDDIVQALNHYTAALQSALRIANST